MNDIQFGNPHSLYLLAVVALGLVAVVVAAVARRRAANRFASAELRGRLFPSATNLGHWISAILLSACLTLMAIACADIRWGKTWREVPQKGIELMFVLDVSRSMLAEDVSPNRLSRAKQQIKDIVDELAGDRIGLISFAGTTRQSVPLTSHYEDFKQTLDSVGPHSVRSGGSRLGDAIAAAADAFISKTHQHKVIVIFTDGEDQESQPIQIATRLHDEQGIRVFTVGLGDTDQGARIPEQDPQRGTPTGGFVQYNGQQVWSKMNGSVLRQVAQASNGAYIPAGTRRVNMADVYHRFIANVPQTEFETAKINAYVARYQWFAAPALLLLLLEIGYAGFRNMRILTRVAKPAALIFLPLLTLAPASSASAAPPAAEPQAAALNAGNALVREGKFEQAIEHFQNIKPQPPLRDQRNYNLAVAQYRNGDIAAAKSLFADVASGQDAALAARSRYNLGNCFYADAVQSAEQNPQAAIAALQTAIEHYRGTLRVDPQHADARANLELAANWLRELNQPREEPPQENKEQGEDQQDEENQGQEQQQQDQQPGQDQENNGGENNAAESEQGNQQGGEGEGESKAESEGEREGETQMESENDSDSDSDSGAGQLNDRKPEGDQEAAAPSEPLPDGQSPGQDDPDSSQAEPLQAPQGELTAADQEQAQPATAGQPAEDSQGVRMTREEALKMLQAVRDRDMLRRLQHERSERSRRQTVDRDW